LRVLIAEGHEDNAQTTAWLLRLYGHEVQIAADGPSALQAALAGSFDVVLLEIILPGLCGWDVARRLRECKTAGRPVLIAVTGLGRPEDRRRSAQAGIDLHLVKPVDPELLRKVLERLHWSRSKANKWPRARSGLDKGICGVGARKVVRKAVDARRLLALVEEALAQPN
jgi:CheY-like chemotaxis protein